MSPRATLDKQPRQVAAMFDAVAPRYDVANDVISLGRSRAWRAVVRDAARVEPGQRVLDVAAGTGTSSWPFAQAGAQVVAADFSLGMLAQGRRRRPELPFVAADATALPFADASFAAVTISFGLRNVVDVPAALAEFWRVAQPGGRVVVCEFSHPTLAALRAVYFPYLRHVLPALAGRVSPDPESYRYLSESIQAWPDQRRLAGMLAQAGWSQVEWRNLSGGIVAVHRAVRPA